MYIMKPLRNKNIKEFAINENILHRLSLIQTIINMNIKYDNKFFYIVDKKKAFSNMLTAVRKVNEM